MERNVPKLRFKGFNDEWEEYRIGDKVDVAGVLEINSFNGVESLQINVKDLMKSV